MKKVKIPTPKGNIAAVIHYPKNKTDKLAILCPGYLDSKDYEHLKTLAEDLTKEGYTVVRFDPIGVWESNGNISDYTTTQYLEDIKNVFEYMLKQDDFEHILIGGHSRGGKVSILYAAHDSRISEVIGIMPSSVHRMKNFVSSSGRLLNYALSNRDLPQNKNMKREFRVPFSHFKDLKKYDVLKDVKNIKVPLILIAGESDKLVPPETVRRIFDEANEPKKFILIPDINHDYRHSLSEIRLVNNEILKALKEYEE